jgi:CheY-like chemotaxis protein
VESPSALDPNVRYIFGMDTVLLVDDDDDIAMLLRVTISKVPSDLALQHVTSVKEAIQYLSRQGVYEDKERFPFPCAVLLDMKLPGAGGTELLKWIREKSELQFLPVAVWSGQEWSKEKEEAYALGASLYIPKPMHAFGFLEIIQSLKELCDRMLRPGIAHVEDR